MYLFVIIYKFSRISKLSLFRTIPSNANYVFILRLFILIDAVNLDNKHRGRETQSLISIRNERLPVV